MRTIPDNRDSNKNTQPPGVIFITPDRSSLHTVCARALAPLFKRATAWRVLDGAIGSMVLLLAVTQLR